MSSPCILTLMTLQSGPENPLLHRHEFGAMQVPVSCVQFMFDITKLIRAVGNEIKRESECDDFTVSTTACTGSHSSTDGCCAIVRRPSFVAYAFQLLRFRNDATLLKGFVCAVVPLQFTRKPGRLFVVDVLLCAAFTHGQLCHACYAAQPWTQLSEHSGPNQNSSQWQLLF